MYVISFSTTAAAACRKKQYDAKKINLVNFLLLLTWFKHSSRDKEVCRMNICVEKVFNTPRYSMCQITTAKLMP